MLTLFIISPLKQDMLQYTNTRSVIKMHPLLYFPLNHSYLLTCVRKATTPPPPVKFIKFVQEGELKNKPRPVLRTGNDCALSHRVCASLVLRSLCENNLMQGRFPFHHINISYSLFT